VSTATKRHLILFDLARSRPKNVPESEVWCTVEACKNGSVLKSKWETETILFNTPVVIVFMNYMPDKSYLSEDRWHICLLNDKRLTKLS